MIIGFSTTDKLVSKILRRITRSEASHSYVLFQVAGETMVIHANQQGVNCDYYNKFCRKNKIVVEYKLLITKDAEQCALSHAIRLLDKKYDFGSIIGFGWVLLNRVFGRRVKNPFPSRSAYQCSEFALEEMRCAGLQDLDAYDRELTAPEDLIHCLSAHQQAKEV